MEETKYRYIFINYVQIAQKGESRGKYRFFENFLDEGITVDDYREFLPVLNYYGQTGWQFVCWDSGRLLMRQEY